VSGVLIETKTDAEPAAAAKVRRGGTKSWHAVTIAAPAGACAAAQACKGKRYLSCDAPRLPLAKCESPHCECKYRHFSDRRGPPRRHDEMGGVLQVRKKSSRRTSRGRRPAD
jgi:hypothetical protein